jgi:hypothetical protein
MGRYACSTELYGQPSWNCLDGIGTICHEFGHVLGLPDFYDTDYEGSGGESAHPDNWSTMSGGSYLNNSRTPVAYTLFERYMLGWAMPTVINGAGALRLEVLEKANTGYRINSGVKKEFFILENRQKTKWDYFLPGHGMLVYRVDSTNTNVWEMNQVNVNPKHNYFELLRAGGARNGAMATETDPFPGAMNVTELNNMTSPAHLRSWSGKDSPWGLNAITEEDDGAVTFEVIDVNVLTGLSLPADTVIIGLNTPYKLQETRVPSYAPYSLTWTSSNPEVCTVDANGYVTGLSLGTSVITIVDGGVNHLEAQCVVRVEDLKMVDGIAAFKAMNIGEEALLRLTDAQVLYVYNGLCYVRDASGSIVLTGLGTSLRRNDRLNGVVYGAYDVNNLMPRLVAVGNRTNISQLTVTAGADAEPRPMHISELSEQDYADLVCLTKCRLESRSNGVFAVSGDHAANVYNLLKASLTSPKQPYTNRRFDITGLLMTRQLGGELVTVISPLKIDEVSPDYYTLTYSVGEGGCLLFGTTELRGNGEKSIMNDETLTLTVVPDEGFALQQLLADGYEMTGHVAGWAAMLAGHSVSVSFRDASAISGVEADVAAGAVKVLTLDGRHVGARLTDGLPAGIYVVRLTDGRAVKVLKR